MDKRIWSIITRMVVSVNRSIPRSGRRPKYPDALIVRMYFWSAWNDRPLCWACQRSHYGSLFRPRLLPSISQFSRRMRTDRVGAMIAAVNERLSRSDEPALLLFLDGKALAVSEATQDKQARTGRGNGTFSRGYKLHALGTEDGRIKAFCVRPLNEHEVPLAASVLASQVDCGALVLGDGNYDGDQLYQAIDDRGSYLLTPLRGRTRSLQKLRQMSAGRRRAIAMWDNHERQCRKIYRLRTGIERIFSALTCFGGGLGPLPAWVRGLRRVTLWVTTKIAIYHARLKARRSTMEPA